MVSAVEKHYNERARYGKSDGCAPLRGLLNAVKNTEIVRAPVPCKERRKHITLVGAGHGAQIQFLQQNKFTDVDAYGTCACACVWWVCGIDWLRLDVSRVALETLHDRAAAGMVVNLHHCDFTQPLPVDQEHKPASLVEAGLCLHYGASSEQCMRQLVSNLQSLVALNGRLIVTIPNSQFIIFCFRVQWVRVWSGRSWDDAFSALVKCENNCVRAVQSLGGFQPPTNIEDCVPAEFVDKLSGSGDGTLPHRILLERAMGVVDIPKCCTLVAQFRVTLETPPTLGPDEFGKTYFFRLHSSVNENTFCPEPFVPASAWDMFAAAGFRACSGYQDVLAWLKHRQNSSNEQIYRALGASPIGVDILV